MSEFRKVWLIRPIITPLSGLLTIPELAAASNEAEATWRKRIFFRKITYVKCGGSVRVRRNVFERWLRDRTVPAKPGERSCAAKEAGVRR
jgi:hypothetical protein